MIFGHHIARDYDPNGNKQFTPLDLLLDQENYEDNKTLKVFYEDKVISYEVVTVVYVDINKEENMFFFRINYSIDLNGNIDENYFSTFKALIDKNQKYSKTGLLEAIDYEQGKLSANSKEISLCKLKNYSRHDIKRIRESSRLSQSLFASVIGVSKKTVEAWEAGRNHPDGAATRLISLIENDNTFPYTSKIITIKEIKK